MYATTSDSGNIGIPIRLKILMSPELFNRDLNVFVDSAVATVLGGLFHIAIILLL
jgi:hypothetical protein